MTYKLKVERLANQRRWYARHPEAKDTIRATRDRLRARNAAIVEEAFAERCPCGLADENHLTMRRRDAHRLARIPCGLAKLARFIEECPNR